MAHWTVEKNIVKYLRKMKYMIFIFDGKDEIKVSGYSDAKFQMDWDNIYSQFD